MVLLDKPEEGVKVALLPLVLREPLTLLPPLVTLNVLEDTVEPLIESLNVAEMVVPVETLVEPLDGLTEFTDMYVGAGFEGDDVVNEVSLP